MKQIEINVTAHVKFIRFFADCIAIKLSDIMLSHSEWDALRRPLLSAQLIVRPGRNTSLTLQQFVFIEVNDLIILSVDYFPQGGSFFIKGLKHLNTFSQLESLLQKAVDSKKNCPI
ncbi:MAG: hypothetical protein IJ864_00165 [Alphaproteobacteria bacterium]|nr:hypothetical protein [Alphaproteobacteria bacterium]